MSSLHYKFTGETKNYRYYSLDASGYKDVVLHRIKATRYLLWHDVKKGDLGGWIESTDNLTGKAWVADNAKVFDDAVVSGNALVSDDAMVANKAQVLDNAKVSGNASVYGNAVVSGNAFVIDDARVTNKAKVLDDSFVYSNAFIYGDANISGSARVGGNAHVTGDALVTGDAIVSDDARVFGNAVVSNNAIVSDKAVIPKESRIFESSDYLSFTTHTVVPLHLTLTRQEDGEHCIATGYWSGTVDELEELFKLDRWIVTSGKNVERLRPKMLAMCDTLRARINSWQDEDEE